MSQWSKPKPYTSKGDPSDPHDQKIYFKYKGNSMCIFEGLTWSNAFLRVKALKRLYNDWRGEFIITK
jgi:hypothetical protein